MEKKEVSIEDILEHVTNEVSNEVDDNDDDDDVILGGGVFLGGWGGLLGEDQNSGDVMGGGPSNVENDDDHHDDNRSNQNYIRNNSRVAPVSNPSQPKKKCFVWSTYIKDRIKKELADCIGHDNIKNLTPARAQEFLEKYNLRDRSYLMLKI